ncbi:MAG: hypothetical protein IPK74_07075 [Deltaproteobacteria bacterium]|nr:hypothetical protein [Deltaproteobacteria bacterium]
MRGRAAGWFPSMGALVASLVCGACRHDTSHADGGGSAGDSSGGGNTVSATAAEADGTAGDCMATCDDGDPCTIDQCDGDTCTHAPLVDNACRPAIDVEYPPRAATVTGAAGSSSVTVTGSVHSGLGDITSLTLGGEPVEVAQDGSFSHTVDAVVGGNLLVFEATDSAGNARRRVQSFLWSTGFREPMTAGDQPVPEGLGFWLGQESLDDGDHALPLDDLATALELALASFDTNQFADPTTPITSSAGFDVYLSSLDLGSAEVSLQGADGGIHIGAAIQDIVGDLVFDCTNFGCELAGGDGTGGVSVSAVQVDGLLSIDVDAEHHLVATLSGVDATVDPDDVDIWSNNGWTNFLLSVVEIFIHDSLVSSLEGALEDQIESNLGPALAGGLSDLSLATTFDFPNLGNARKSIPVELVADFASTDFHDGVAPPEPSPPQGGAVVLRAGGYPTLAVTPYENDGVPNRDGCGAGPQALSMPRSAPLEIVLADDTLNQLLFAGWRGGLLEFPLGDGAGGGLLEDLKVDVSGMLAPTISDCGPGGKLLATIGDIRIDASFTSNGNPVEFTAFTTLVVEMSLNAGETGVSIDLGEVELVQTELTADDAHIGMEESLTELLEAQLVVGLLGQLGTDGFAQITLPEIDLSSKLGLAPGTALITIHADEVVRDGGNSVISARF